MGYPGGPGGRGSIRFRVRYRTAKQKHPIVTKVSRANGELNMMNSSKVSPMERMFKIQRLRHTWDCYLYRTATAETKKILGVMDDGRKRLYHSQKRIVLRTLVRSLPVSGRQADASTRETKFVHIAIHLFFRQRPRIRIHFIIMIIAKKYGVSWTFHENYERITIYGNIFHKFYEISWKDHPS